VTQSKQDIEQMRDLFFQLKFDEIVTTIDARCTKEMTDGIMKIYNKAKDGKTQLLVFVYYSGHGIMRNDNYCVINSPNMWERYFCLEEKLRRLT
jgi:hypothetical protein